MNILIRFYLLDQDPDLTLIEILNFIKIRDFTILKKSIDARNKNNIAIEYQLKILDIIENMEESTQFKEKQLSIKNQKLNGKIINDFKRTDSNKKELNPKEKDKEKEREKELYIIEKLNDSGLKKRFKIQIVKKLEIEKDIFNIKDYFEQLDKKFQLNGKDKTFNDNIKNSQDNINKFVDIRVTNRPIIIGFGPAAIFAVFGFLENGISPIVIEMGQEVEQRNKTIEKYLNEKIFNPYSNINFGEGGAGTYSDGKLLTRSRDITNNKIFSLFNYFGVPKSILYDANPHIGSDNLVKVLANIREYFIQKNVEILFNTKLVDITRKSDKWVLHLVNIKDNNIFQLETKIVVLATGHSCKDVYKILYKLGANLDAKPFAIGFRVEHPRNLIDKNQYGRFAKILPSANYKLLYKGKYSNIYSFCMCPGGTVLPSNSDYDEIVTNGASKYSRDAVNSNSAIVASFNIEQSKRFLDEINHNFIGKIVDFNPASYIDNFSNSKINKSFEIELGLVIKNKIRFEINDIIKEKIRSNEENNSFKIKDYYEIKNDFNENKIKCLDWEINLIIQQFFEKIAFYLSDEKYKAPGESILNFYQDENIENYKKKENLRKSDKFQNFNISYPFGIYIAKILNLFDKEIKLDFLNAFKYFDKIIPGFINSGIAIGYETRTSSAVKVLRDENGMVLQGIFMIGEGSGYCGGITTSAVDGYKIASLLAKNLI